MYVYLRTAQLLPYLFCRGAYWLNTASLFSLLDWVLTVDIFGLLEWSHSNIMQRKLLTSKGCIASFIQSSNCMQVLLLHACPNIGCMDKEHRQSPSLLTASASIHSCIYCHACTKTIYLLLLSYFQVVDGTHLRRIHMKYSPTILIKFLQRWIFHLRWVPRIL